MGVARGLRAKVEELFDVVSFLKSAFDIAARKDVVFTP
jgi:hypothetical protein